MLTFLFANRVDPDKTSHLSPSDLSLYCLHMSLFWERVVEWVTFQCRGVQLIWIIVRLGPAARAVCAGGVVWTIFLQSIISFFFFPHYGKRPDIDRNIVSKGR